MYKSFNIQKMKTTIIGLLLFLVAYLCTEFFVLVTQLNGILSTSEFQTGLQWTGLPIMTTTGMILVYISAPFIFVVGKAVELIGIDPHNSIYPNSYPLITSFVVVGVYMLLFFFTQKVKKR